MSRPSVCISTCEARSPSDLTAADWRGEMLQFAVSDEYADLRDAIGVGVEDRS